MASQVTCQYNNEWCSFTLLTIKRHLHSFIHRTCTWPWIMLKCLYTWLVGPYGQYYKWFEIVSLVVESTQRSETFWKRRRRRVYRYAHVFEISMDYICADILKYFPVFLCAWSQHDCFSIGTHSTLGWSHFYQLKNGWNDEYTWWRVSRVFQKYKSVFSKQDISFSLAARFFKYLHAYFVQVNFRKVLREGTDESIKTSSLGARMLKHVKKLVHNASFATQVCSIICDK